MLWVVSDNAHKRCICKLSQKLKGGKDLFQLGDQRRCHARPPGHVGQVQSRYEDMTEDIVDGENGTNRMRGQVDREVKCFKTAKAQECGKKRWETKAEKWLQPSPGCLCQATEIRLHLPRVGFERRTAL